jgi:hypothetical protein
MRAERPLRIPLQIGTSALHSLARASALFIPGIIATAVPAGFFLWAFSDIDLGEAGGYIFAIIVAPGFALLGFAWKHARRARDARPSDVILDASGFAIAGGPQDGRRISWSDVAGVDMETPPKPKANDKDQTDDSDLKQLCVYVRREKGKPTRVLLAAAELEVEQRSLRELAKTLRAERSAPRAKIDQPTKNELLSCPSCGAVIAPSPDATVTCSHCQGSVTVPKPMRDRLRDAAAVAARPDAIVAKLLDQPGADRVGRLFTGAAVFMVTAWPVTLLMLVRNYREHALAFGSTAFVFLFLIACILGFFGLIRGQLVDRHALRLVALDFAAHAPSAPGEPFLCRSCVAPLPDRGERVLVHCIYCDAENVLGIDLRREASAARKETRSLNEALAVRATERRQWRGVTVLAVLLIGVAGWSLRRGVGRNERTWPLEQRCDSGDLEGCVALADLIGSNAPPDVHADGKRAVKLYTRACDAKMGAACESLANLYEDYVALPSGHDPRRAVVFRARACDLGRGAACLSLAKTYEKGNLLAHVERDADKAREFYDKACAAGVEPCAKR